jgi:hypothetical protein
VKTNKRLRTRVAVGGVVVLLGAGAAVGTQYLASANAAETKAVFKPIAGKVPAAPKPAPAEAGWKEVWHPDLSKQGMKAFEGLEDDRGHGDPSRQHAGIVGGSLEVDMTMKVKDSTGNGDRQRVEVKGMRDEKGGILEMREGETWRISYQMYIPSSLQATTSFTHIMQFKMPGPGSAPIMVTSLRRVNGTPMIEQNLFGQEVFARTPLAPLQNKWITATVELTIGDKTKGAAAWSVQADGKTVARASQAHVDTFLADRVRPKWGIYRSFNDKAHLQDCYLLLTNMRAFKKV